jgi:dTMP kinase
MPAGRPRFITFEGAEACGKSTQVLKLKKRLEQEGFQVLAVREPGGTALGEALRELLARSPAGRDVCPRAELFLFAAARAQLVEEVIRPALESGAWVISDRFCDSSVVYQGTVRGLPWEEIRAVNQWATQGLFPGLTIVLDLPVPELAQRLQDRWKDKPDRMESEFAGRLEEIRQGYLQLAKEEPERVFLLEAVGSEEELADRIWEVVRRAFCLR